MHYANRNPCKSVVYYATGCSTNCHSPPQKSFCFYSIFTKDKLCPCSVEILCTNQTYFYSSLRCYNNDHRCLALYATTNDNSFSAKSGCPTETLTLSHRT